LSDEAQRERVRALCEAAALPVSESELEALTPLYVLFSEGIEKLADLVEETDTAPIRFVVER
jgi:hypothetical protein